MSLFRKISIVVRDILCVCLVLTVFALFHHVLPRPASAMERLTVLDVPAPGAQIASEPALQERSQPNAPHSEPSPAVTSAPAPRPGDFSAAFPSVDTGASALHSYQSDGLKIAVSMANENDVTYYIADVWIKNISAFSTAFAKGQYGTGIHQSPLKTAEANNAILAVTGDYYGARNKGVVIRNGDLYRDSVNGDVCVLYQDGVMETFCEADFDMSAIAERGVWQAWSFGPELLDGANAITDFNSAIKGKNPRNAIGYYEPGHYCFITVDGRQKGYSVGMTLSELSEVFYKLGCTAAYNLDGGATAQMIFKGELVNKPYKGGRQSSDIICF